MKKRFFNISMMFVLVLCTIFCISSCSKDDDKKGDEEQYSIIGKWKGTFSSTEYAIMTFENDGTGSYDEYYKGNLESKDFFTYTFSGTSLKIYYEDSESINATISWQDKNKFITSEDPSVTWVKQ